MMLRVIEIFFSPNYITYKTYWYHFSKLEIVGFVLNAIVITMMTMSLRECCTDRFQRLVWIASSRQAYNHDSSTQLSPWCNNIVLRLA